LLPSACFCADKDIKRCCAVLELKPFVVHSRHTFRQGATKEQRLWNQSWPKCHDKQHKGAAHQESSQYVSRRKSENWQHKSIRPMYAIIAERVLALDSMLCNCCRIGSSSSSISRSFACMWCNYVVCFQSCKDAQIHQLARQPVFGGTGRPDYTCASSSVSGNAMSIISATSSGFK
jgi:hypothetical protein